MDVSEVLVALGPYIASFAALGASVAFVVRSNRSSGAGSASAQDRSQAAAGGGTIFQQQIGERERERQASCSREAEHTVVLRELADVQRRQTAIDEQVVGLIRRMDDRLANIEENVLELVVVERQDQRRQGGA